MTDPVAKQARDDHRGREIERDDAQRDRIGHAAWRAIHWSAYAAWPLAVVHSITAGSDGVAPWMLVLTGLSAFAVGTALFYRLQVGDTNRSRLPGVASGAVDPVPVEPAWRND